jgi:hypothetical protein
MPIVICRTKRSAFDILCVEPVPLVDDARSSITIELQADFESPGREGSRSQEAIFNFAFLVDRVGISFGDKDVGTIRQSLRSGRLQWLESRFRLWFRSRRHCTFMPWFEGFGWRQCLLGVTHCGCDGETAAMRTNETGVCVLLVFEDRTICSSRSRTGIVTSRLNTRPQICQ